MHLQYQKLSLTFIAYFLHKIYPVWHIIYLQAAKSAGVPVILDAGGMDAPISQELLNYVDIFSPNETELGRLTGMPTESFEHISKAVAKCHKMVSFANLKQSS